MEEEKDRNNKGIFPAAILFTAEISHVIPVLKIHSYGDVGTNNG